MDNINVSRSSNVQLVSFLLEGNERRERIASSFITRLEAYHYPDNHQRERINNLLENFSNSDSIKEVMTIKKELSDELRSMSAEISDIREQSFDIVNRNTNQVYGVLSENFTIHDRDNYIKKLMYYREAQEKIAEVTQKCFDGNFAIRVSKLGGHHSSTLYGDMTALESLIKGESAKVPDLTYNVGEWQFG